MRCIQLVISTSKTPIDRKPMAIFPYIPYRELRKSVSIKDMAGPFFKASNYFHHGDPGT